MAETAEAEKAWAAHLSVTAFILRVETPCTLGSTQGQAPIPAAVATSAC